MSKKKKSSGSKSNFNPKEFLILHVEKLVFGLIAGIACLVMYLGFNTTPFPSDKTPEKLQAQATQVSSKLKENHNDVVMKEEGRKVDPIYAKSALNTRVIKDPVAHASNPMGASKTNTSTKRGDPALLAPKHLEASYFYGAVARLSSNPDPLDKLEDAKKTEEKVKTEDNNNSSSEKGMRGKGKGGSSSAGSSGSSGAPSGGGMEGMAGSGMGMMGSGGGEGGDPTLVGQRRLSPMYDLGYKFGMRTFPETATAFNGGDATSSTKPEVAVKKPVAMALGLVCVTALAPHEEMEDNYKKQFYEVVGYTPGRDTPNYVGFEAQRAEVSAANPDKEIAESDWVALPKSSPATFKEQLKILQGTANEVHLPDMVDPNISMPIPPILLTDYRKYASNSVLAELEEKENGALGSPSASGFSSGSSMGMGKGMSSGSSGSMDDGDGMSSGGSAPGAGSMGMPGSSSMGMAGGMAKGGGKSSSGGGSGYQESGATANVVMEMPKQLPSTKYKLVRFYDINPPVGKVFKYRVRLLMYDSNHPEWASFKPAASTLSNDALKRVQALELEEGKEVPKNANAASGPAKRVCQRESSWSDPTKPILILKPASVFIAKDKENKSEAAFESVFVDFEKERAIDVPRKESVEAGLVFGTPTKSKGKELPLEIIHPIKKVIKALKDFRSTNLVTIVSFEKPASLQMGSARDIMKAGAEVVSFDPLTGQIVVSREFENYTSFHLHTQPDSVPVGPLGGGLAVGGSAALGGEGGMSGGEGMGMGMGGPGSMGGPGMMSGSGGGKKGMNSAAGK
jgi:hypothetical protein